MAVGRADTVNYFAGSANVRLAGTHYRRQVEQIAPPKLQGREVELAELAAFSTREQSASYAWWLAEAWAGKSALMSWFVLNPPPGVNVVSFFVTARQAGQSDRVAFLAAVAEQAAALIGSESPIVSGSLADSLVLDLLKQAAAQAEEEGRRLVLVVDGLDEDTGTLVNGVRYSIAGLLPAKPWHGMRIIVAGRPNPPIPVDVLPHHPLRDRSIERALSHSKAAEVTRHESGAELDRLLDGDAVHQDVLALITAAGGGLSAPDLGEISGHSLRAIEHVLQGVSGRTFVPRSPIWAAPDAVPTYILGHEELQLAAQKYLEPRLDALRDRIHAWADGYADRAWPIRTPEYLLSGYFQLLRANGDVERLTRYAMDEARQDRMLDVTGGDVNALTELTTATSLLSRQSSPDLGLALRLAQRRNRLEDRNSQTPTDLPAVWARLGNTVRAEALARSITTPEGHSAALIGLVTALCQLGQLDQAEHLMGLIASPEAQTLAAVQLSKSFTGAGDYERAESIARAIPGADAQANALDHLVRVLIAEAEYERAENVTRMFPRGETQDMLFLLMVDTAAAAGRIVEARETAHRLPRTGLRGEALARLAQRLAAAGDLDEAESIAYNLPRQDESLPKLEGLRTAHLHEVSHEELADRSLDAAILNVVIGLARAGLHLRARDLVATIDEASVRLEAEIEMAAALVAEGSHSEGRKAADRIVDGLPAGEGTRDAAQGKLALAMDQAGDPTYAERAARAISDQEARVSILARLVTLCAHSERYDDAQRIALEIRREPQGLEACIVVAEQLIRVGQLDRARKLLCGREMSLTFGHRNRGAYAQAKGTLSRALAAAGRFDQARQVADVADLQDSAYVELRMDIVGAMIAGGQDDKAEAIARSIAHEFELKGNRTAQVDVLLRLAGTLSREGATERAHQITTLVIDLVGDLSQHDPYVHPTADWAQDLARHNLDNAAMTVTQMISRPPVKATTFGALARIFSAAGNTTEARSAAAQAALAVERTVYWPPPTDSYVALSRTLAADGHHQDAARVALAITVSGPKDTALNQLVHELATAGEYDEAERVAMDISSPHMRSETLTVVAEKVSHHDRAEGIRLAEAAESIARSTALPRADEAALVDLVAALVTAKRKKHAINVCSAIAGPGARARALALVAEASGRHGKLAPDLLAAGLQALRGVDDLNERSASLSALAQALAGCGDVAAATQLVEHVASPVHAGEALVEIVRSHLEDEQYHLADLAAQQITVARIRVTAICALAEALALDGQTDAALHMAGEAEEVMVQIATPRAQVHALAALADVYDLLEASDDRLWCWDEVAWSLENAGNPQYEARAVTAALRPLAERRASSTVEHLTSLAGDIIEDIEDADHRAFALVELAEAVLPSYPAEANRLARSANGTRRELSYRLAEDRVTARVAAVLARTGDEKRAGKLVVETCARARWSVVLNAISALDPDALCQVADEVVTASR